MNATPLEPVRWSQRRWIYTVASLFLAQAALVLYFGQRATAPPQQRPFRTAVYLAADEWSVHQLAHLPDLSDPLLLALPNVQGFSGPAWLKYPRYDYQPPGVSEPPSWLALDEQELGQTFSQYIATNRGAAQLTADKPLPSLLRYEPNYPTTPLAEKSRFRIEDGLANRPLLTPMDIKSWPHSDILSNTTVQAVVDADGFMVTVKLLTESGLKDADLHAMELAAAARFQPLPRGPDGRRTDALTWGRLVFLWHTLPSPTTNLSATPPRL